MYVHVLCMIHEYHYAYHMMNMLLHDPSMTSCEWYVGHAHAFDP